MSFRVSASVRRIAMALIACVILASTASGSQDSSAAQAAGGPIAFVDVNVLPMDSERVLTRHTVVVQGDRIIAVDPADEASLPEGTTVVEAQGQYLIPGLIDAHARLLSDDLISDQYLADELSVMVTHGVTTARHAAGSPALLAARDRVVSDDLLSPVWHVSSPEIASADPPDGFAGITAGSAFEAAAAVRRSREAGYNFISLAFANTADIYQGIVLTARGSRSPLIGRVPADVGLQRALESGQHIEYLDGFLESAAEDDAPLSLSGDDVWVTENWALLDEVNTGRLTDVARAVDDAEVWNIPMLFTMQAAVGNSTTSSEFVGAAAAEVLSQRATAARAMLPDEADRQRYLEYRDRAVAEFRDVSTKLLVGSGDLRFVPPYGEAMPLELGSLVAAGLPPFAALEGATRRAAEFLSFRGGGRTEFATVTEEGIQFRTSTTSNVDYGRVEVGMRADLVLLAGNPLDDIGAVGSIEGVMLRGRWLPRADLDRIRERAARSLQEATLR